MERLEEGVGKSWHGFEPVEPDEVVLGQDGCGWAR
jgi:hypothetical protein